MIIVKLYGGLGNQMFQYAAGRRLSISRGVELALDVSWFGMQEKRRYELDAFDVEAKFASDKDIARLSGRPLSMCRRMVARISGDQEWRPPSYVREKSFSVQSEVMALGDDIYLDGYWQSERYFQDVADVIRREFTVKVALEGRNKSLAEEIASCESVSVHVRRADYVSDEKIHVVHGVCNVDYYNRCMEILADRLSAPRVFVFSDEPAWARENLVLPFPTTIVDHNGPDRNYEDLRLMSQCRHHVIANSTFSWWGAWLNPRPDKIVLAPKRWFRTEERDTRDLIPGAWIKV